MPNIFALAILLSVAIAALVMVHAIIKHMCEKFLLSRKVLRI